MAATLNEQDEVIWMQMYVEALKHMPYPDECAAVADALVNGVKRTIFFDKFPVRILENAKRLWIQMAFIGIGKCAADGAKGSYIADKIVEFADGALMHWQCRFHKRADFSVIPGGDA